MLNEIAVKTLGRIFSGEKKATINEELAIMGLVVLGIQQFEENEQFADKLADYFGEIAAQEINNWIMANKKESKS